MTATQRKTVSVNAELVLLPTGYFLAKPSTIGSSAEEMEAMSRGEVPEDRVREIRSRMELDAFNLGTVQPKGFC